MKILHLVNHVRNVGNGIVNVAVDLAIEQQRLGHEVIVASAGGEFVSLLDSCGVQHVQVRQSGRLAPFALPKIASLVRSERIDIINAHMMAGAVMARIALVGTSARLVTTVHNSFARHSVLMKVGHRVIAVSDAVRIQMIERGIRSNRIHTVVNGTLNTRRTSLPSPAASVHMDHPAILTIAGLYKRKGISDLIRAYCAVKLSVPAAMLYIAGDGPDRVAFEDESAGTQYKEDIVFLGFRTDARELLSQCDVFVLASHADPCPLVIAEARSAGKPIVATAVDGIPQALDDGDAGLLVPARDTKALAAAIITVLLNEQVRDALRSASIRGIERFTVGRVAAETLLVYKAAVGM